LLHDYEVAKNSYVILSQKRAQAFIAFQLEIEYEKGPTFILLSPASLPRNPAFPNRVLCAVSGLVVGSIFEILLMPYLSRGLVYTSQPSPVGTTNWWGLSSVVGLLAWFLFYTNNAPCTLNDYVLFWGGLVLVHCCGIEAARRPYGWLYLTPLETFWVIVVAAGRGIL
jgi:hypothetical protein